MTKRRLIVTILALGALAALMLVLNRRDEPSYNGRKLSDWVRRFDWTQPDDRRTEAGEALRHIGTNAVPYLVRAISYEDPSWKIILRRLCFRISADTLQGECLLRGRELDAGAATRAFMHLGSDADGAIPQLIALLQFSRDPAPRAAAVLGSIGKPALGPLLNIATNARPQIRPIAISAIGSMGTNAVPALPMLVEYADHTSLALALSAIQAIGNIAAEPATVVPILTKALDDPRTEVRMAAAGALGEFGDRARPAVARLLAARNDPNSQVRRNATNALRQIVSEILTNALPK